MNENAIVEELGYTVLILAVIRRKIKVNIHNSSYLTLFKKLLCQFVICNELNEIQRSFLCFGIGLRTFHLQGGDILDSGPQSFRTSAISGTSE